MYGEVGVIDMNNQMNNQVNQTINQGVNKPNTSNQVSDPGVRPMPKAAKNNPKYTENWIPLKAISNGIMYNNRNEMITGVKIQPRNIFILDQSSMDNALIGLMNFYNTMDFEFWLVIADRPVDISVYIAELQMMYNQAQNPVIRKLINQDMSKADEFCDTVSDVEFYFLFKDKNVEMIQKKIRLMINGLANAGLSSSQANNDDLRSILDNFLNGGNKTEFGTVLA